MESGNSVDGTEAMSDEMLQQLRRWQQEQKNRLIEQQQQQRQLLIEKQKKLLSMINDTSQTPPSPPNVDDVPLKKPRAVRSFQQLLETSIDQDKKHLPAKKNGERKFPFLKRGQGISRFGQVTKPKIVKVASQRKEDKENQTPNIPPPQSKFEQPSHHQLKPIKDDENDDTIKELVAFNPSSHVEVSNNNNSSRNEEDLAVFELLERFANINSSFSSSSSLIGQLIDKGITHLPSPSKVVHFLSKKPARAATTATRRHVRFAETVDEVEHPEEPEEMEEPPPSPFVSNTIRPNTVGRQESKDDDLDETPTSPIGFPDYQKLFGNPSMMRPLWTDQEELASPTTVQRDHFNLKSDESSTSNDHSDPVLQQQIREAAMPISLPIEDPRVVYQTSLLRSRLTSLEREIANYRRETDALRRAKREHDEAKQKLEQERDKFQRYADNEKRRLNLLYTEEQKRVRAEQLKDLPQLKENETELKRLKDELKTAKDDHRQKENKWMANQTKVQEKIRSLELRNRQLADDLDKARAEEQHLRRRLNASLRPGAMAKSLSSKSEKLTSVEGKSASPTSSPGPQPIPSPVLPTQDDTIPSKTMASATTNDIIHQPEDVAHLKTMASPASGTSVSQAVLPDGTRLILYANGNRKEIWPDGRGSQVVYYNGDVKQKLADGSVVYTYADSGTKHTTKPDGTDILEFASGQVETTYPDGRSQVQYPGGAVKIKYPDGREDSKLPDGTTLWTDGKGHGVMTFPSGVKEIYTPICKRREYPDGTVKTVYEDGRSETRYANGRIRVKDQTGKIVTDTGETS